MMRIGGAMYVNMALIGYRSSPIFTGSRPVLCPYLSTFDQRIHCSHCRVFAMVRPFLFSLLSATLSLFSLTAHAQTAVAVFDTLDVRHDLGKPAITRFQAARYHATACMYNGRTDEQRKTALLLLDLANELKQDTLLAHANVVVGYSFRQGGDPERALQYEYKGLEYAERGGSTDDRLGGEDGIRFKQLQQYRQAIHWLKRGEARITRSPR